MNSVVKDCNPEIVFRNVCQGYTGYNLSPPSIMFCSDFKADCDPKNCRTFCNWVENIWILSSLRAWNSRRNEPTDPVKIKMEKDSGGTKGGKASGREVSGGVSSGSSGISSAGLSDTSSEISEQRRQNNQQPATILLSLCEKGEWILLENRLRVTEKGDPTLTVSDEVGL